MQNIAFTKPEKFMPTPNPYRQTCFFTSINQLRQLPPDVNREVAFAGRSNAGKSSAINTLCDQKNLCKTSSTPGRTQMINFFQINPNDERLYLVDLPGYGYAKVPLKIKKHWQNLLQQYLQRRQSLLGLVLIMDIRRPVTEDDALMLNWCVQSDMPVHVLLTKADKLKRGAAKSTLQKTRKILESEYGAASVQLFSASKKEGVQTLITKLDAWLGLGRTA